MLKMTGQGTIADSLLSGALGIGSTQMKSKVILDFTYYKRTKQTPIMENWIGDTILNSVVRI